MIETPCRRPSRGTSKEDLVARHKAKMMGKFFRNQDPSHRKSGTIRDHKGVI